MTASPKSRPFALVIALLAVAFFAGGVWQLQDQIVDDGYIFFRLAQNFVDGHGIVWNVGEAPTEGATNFLHFAAISALMATGLEPAFASLLLSSSCALAIFFIAWRVMRAKLGSLLPVGVTILAVFLVDERVTIDAAVGGLGSLIDGLAAFLVWVAALRQLKAPTSRNALLLGLAAFLSSIARPTGALFTAVVYAVLLVSALAELRGGEKQRLRAWGIAAGVTAIGGIGFAAFKLATFGYLLPNSYYLKSSAEFDVQWSATGEYLLHIVTPLAIPLLAALALSTREGWRSLFEGERAKTRLFVTLLPPLLLVIYYILSTVVAVANFRFFFPSYIFFHIGLVAMLPACRRGSEQLRNRVLMISVLCALGIGMGRGYTHGLLQFPPERLPMGPLEAELKLIGESLGATGLGHDATLLNDSAGATPFFSNFRHVDRGGLVTNELSGREPMTGLEREEFIWAQDLDLYIGWEPPASIGAEIHDVDPRMQSAYVRVCLLKDARDQTSIRSFAQTRELLHLRMRELRDNWRLVGQIEPASYWENAWGVKYLAYVRVDSPHIEVITKALGPLIEVRPKKIDWDGISKFSEKQHLKELFEQTGGNYAKMAKIFLGDRRLAPVIKASCRRLRIK